MYSVSLNNKSCMFDDGEFETLEEAIEFARGRGGKYSVNICSGNPLGVFNSVHLSYNNATDKFSLDTGWGWDELSNEKLIKTLENYV